jgi:hypothetical protein
VVPQPGLEGDERPNLVSGKSPQELCPEIGRSPPALSRTAAPPTRSKPATLSNGRRAQRAMGRPKPFLVGVDQLRGRYRYATSRSEACPCPPGTMGQRQIVREAREVRIQEGADLERGVACSCGRLWEHGPGQVVVTSDFRRRRKCALGLINLCPQVIRCKASPGGTARIASSMYRSVDTRIRPE